MTIAGLLIATFLSTTAWIEPPPVAPKIEQPVPPVNAKEKDEVPQPIKAMITAGKDTTYFTEPIDKDGYVDYFTALNNHLKKGVTPENNANLLFLKAMGPEPVGVRLPAEYFKWLGIDELPGKGDYFIGIGSFIFNREKDSKKRMYFNELVSELGIRPWKAKDHPDVADWLKANEKPLSIVVEGTKRSRYYLPLVPFPSKDGTWMLIGSPVPSVQKHREFTLALTVRANLHLGENQPDEAWQDLLACHRLGRLVAQGGTLFEWLVGIALDAIASRSDLSFIEHARLDTKQLKACLGDLKRLPPMPSLADKVDLGERMTFIDSVTMMQRKGPDVLFRLESIIGLMGSKDQKGSDRLNALKTWLFVNAFHWDSILRDGNRWNDRRVAAMRTTDRNEREAKLKKIDADLMKMKEDLTRVLSWGTVHAVVNVDARSKKLGNVIICLMMPAFSQVQHAGDRVEQIHRNLRVAFALAMYRNDEGRYPPKLDALAPRYLPQVPNDLFSGKELIYRPTAAGYLLYSVGVNGRDDQGRSSEDTRAATICRCACRRPGRRTNEHGPMLCGSDGSCYNQNTENKDDTGWSAMKTSMGTSEEEEPCRIRRSAFSYTEGKRRNP